MLLVIDEVFSRREGVSFQPSLTLSAMRGVRSPSAIYVLDANSSPTGAAAGV